MLETGSFLADRYEVIEKIGTGGMSDVYRAVDQVLQRDVAIKVLKSEFAEDDNFVTKFRSEASNAAKLEHPNIVNIYDVGSEDGLYFIIMEYVDGITLKTYIEKKGHLNYKEVISIAIQVGRGIEAAHNNKIIHRDIKPQNIIISKEGKVKVTDFGIARAASGNTVSADVMGSVHYISPEQARNGYVTAQSDIYSLGIVMYEMATGRVPFDGDTAVAVALKHLQGEMTAPSQLVSDIPISLERIIIRATMKSPERRYADVDELLIDLKKALVTPNEDFVVIPDTNDNDKTKIITQDDLDKIRENSDPDMSDYTGEEDDDTEDDSKLNPKMEKAVTIMVIAAAAIIALLFLFLIANYFGWMNGSKASKSNKEATKTEKEAGNIEVPSLLGMSKDQAEAKLAKLGLKLSVKDGTVASNKYDKNTIATQSVKAGRKVVKGTTVKVAMSGGASKIEDTITVPKVGGLSEVEAKNELDKAGLKSSVEYTHSDSVEQGKVIDQTPKANSEVADGSTVKIIVSQGQDQVQVPSVKGLDQNTAISTLAAAGLSADIQTAASDEFEAGKVISQATEAGSYVKPSSTVSITVSTGSSKVTIPTITGMTESSAKSTLEGAGLKLGTATSTTTTADQTKDGTIATQDTGSVAKGTAVNYTIYKFTAAAPVGTP
ncbi:MAG: Stk1 family PASTA domain-containing Ser/Thr kinase [Lachnospiraceae bacterium]|nr:Stk1 family PASTA domain-containing Ser/Thr kinase [Lachnospiraceae bacterium]